MVARNRRQAGAAAPNGKGARSASTVDRILTSAVKAILERGAGKTSMLDVAEAARVSRGTLYRYFPTKDQLLEAVTGHLRSEYDARVLKATAGRDDPEGRLRDLLDFLGEYLDSGQPHRFLEMEPEFAFGYYRRNFRHFLAVTEAVLQPVFDGWERRAGVKLDHPLMTELLVRYILSDLLVPAGPARRDLADRLFKLLADLGAH